MKATRGYVSLGLVAGSMLAVGCAKDVHHPPFATDTCVNPPCRAATYHGSPVGDSGITDAGPSDAGADAPD
ncbi:MAG TPA: hypothetical protein VH062_17500 [Polyangiaceae bacterium]|nr:hypothetical protein [Polyangiaceae bacterium]